MFEDSGNLNSGTDSNSFEFSDIFDWEAYEYGVQDNVQTKIHRASNDDETIRIGATSNSSSTSGQQVWSPTENPPVSPFPSDFPDFTARKGFAGEDGQPGVFGSGSAAPMVPKYSDLQFMTQTNTYQSIPTEDTAGELYGSHILLPLGDFTVGATKNNPWSTVDVMPIEWHNQPQIPKPSPFSSSTATSVSKSYGSEASSAETAFSPGIGSTKHISRSGFHKYQKHTHENTQSLPDSTGWVSNTPQVGTGDASAGDVGFSGQVAFGSPFSSLTNLDTSQAVYIWNEQDNLMNIDVSTSSFNNLPFSHSRLSSNLPAPMFETSTNSNVPRSYRSDEAVAQACVQSFVPVARGLMNNQGTYNQERFPGNSNLTTHYHLGAGLHNDSRPSTGAPSQIPYRIRQESCYNQLPGHHLAILDFNQNPRKKIRERACFDDEKRMKVALTRKKGACIICRVRKVLCETVPGYDYCLNCMKTAGETVTAHHICVRQQLKETRFRVTDFYYREFRQNGLLFYSRYYDAQRSNTSNSRISIAHAPRFGKLPVLHVEVHFYPGNDIPNIFHKAGRVGDSSGQLYTTQHYMIVETSLPDVKQLDAWGREMLMAKCRLDPHNLQSSIDEVLLRYCEVNQNPEIKTLLSSTMRIVSLSACRARPPVNYEESMKRIADVSGDWSDRERERGVDVSDEVYAQLVVIALAGIEEAEEFVLEILDRLRNEIKIGQLEWVAVGTCLMRLLLVYRDQALRYANGRKLVGSNVDPRATRAMLMYDTLTAVYGTTFHKTQSPLSSQVSIDNYREVLFNDHSLLQSMRSLQFHYMRFCKGEEFEAEDATFQKLVAQPLLQAIKKQKSTADHGA